MVLLRRPSAQPCGTPRAIAEPQSLVRASIWRDSAPPAEMVAGLALRVGLVGLLCAVAIGIFSKRRVLLDRA